jgi:hypothetical protein
LTGSIAGTGANATAEAISLTKRFNDSGVVGCLTVTPYYMLFMAQRCGFAGSPYRNNRRGSVGDMVINQFFQRLA